MTLGTKRGTHHKQREPYKMLWYAENIEAAMADKRKWKWNPYQCLCYFAAKHKACPALNTYGDYSIERDTKLMAQAMASLEHDQMDIQTAIDVYFERVVPNQPWHLQNGATVVTFRSALARIKQLIQHERRFERRNEAALAKPAFPEAALPFDRDCPWLQLAGPDADGLLSNDEIDRIGAYGGRPNFSWDYAYGDGLTNAEIDQIAARRNSYCDGRGRVWELGIDDGMVAVQFQRNETCPHCAKRAERAVKGKETT